MKDKLLPLVKSSCRAAGVELYFGRGATILCDNVPVSGYFDPGRPRLAVARGNTEWEYILLHEFQHMQQWLEQIPLWKQCQEFSDYQFADALQGKEINEELWRQECLLDMAIERDCEQRVVKKLIKWDCSNEDIRDYIKQANAYTMFYLHLIESKKWNLPGRGAYQIKRVWQQFPETFDIDVEKEYEIRKNLYSLCFIPED